MHSPNNDCPCVNATELFVPTCTRSNGEPGIKPSFGLSCYPLNYGASFCDTHDLFSSPVCQGPRDSIPAYCLESWCFVDFEKCKKSPELMSKSELDQPSDLLYWSYTTCNSTDTAWDWFSTLRDVRQKQSLSVTITGSFFPHHFKFNATQNGFASFHGDEYYDNSIPFEGAVIDYFNAIIDNSDDIEMVNYVFLSKGSQTMLPNSSFTAAVRDVQMGISDLAVGPFWITPERLMMTPFTVPVHMDKIVLVIKKPSVDNSFAAELRNLMRPFTPGLWCLLLLAVFMTAGLSIWFAGPKSNNQRPWLVFQSAQWKDGSCTRRFFLLYRLFLEAVLQSGLFLMGGAVEQDLQQSFPYKLLMFGFSIFIIVATASYVANLAAFLTLSGVSDHVATMEGAVHYQMRVCANPILRDGFEDGFPNAKFVFNEEVRGIDGILQFYDEGKCSLMALSLLDTYYEKYYMEEMCKRQLVLTEEVVLSVPIAFPVKKKFSAALSYWLYTGQRYHNIIYEDYYRRFQPSVSCSVELGEQDFANAADVDGLRPVTISNMCGPYFFLTLFTALAIIVKFCTKANAEAIAHFLVESTRMDEGLTSFVLQVAGNAHLELDYESESINGFSNLAVANDISQRILAKQNDCDGLPKNRKPSKLSIIHDEEKFKEVLENAVRNSIHEVMRNRTKQNKA